MTEAPFTPAEVEAVAAKLTKAQAIMVSNPVPGVIAGLFCCSDTPDPLDSLPSGLCGPRFEPNDFASRGYRHAARLLRFGLAVCAHLQAQEKSE